MSIEKTIEAQISDRRAKLVQVHRITCYREWLQRQQDSDIGSILLRGALETGNALASDATRDDVILLIIQHEMKVSGFLPDVSLSDLWNGFLDEIRTLNADLVKLMCPLTFPPAR
jgi:hypothetical protein